MNYYPDFAALLDQYLEDQERSGAWLAQRLDVNPATVTRWRSGVSRPGQPEVVIQVADLLGIHGEERQRLLNAAGYAALVTQSASKFAAAKSTASSLTEDDVDSLWQNYSPRYRQTEISILKQWLEIGASGLLLGLAGSGVSTLLRYLVQQPTVLTKRSVHSNALGPVWIELQPATEATADTIYRSLLRGILDHSPLASDYFPTALLQTAVGYLATTDPFVLQSTLFDLVAHCRQTEMGLLLLFDRVDQLSAASQRNVGNTLRALRDHFPETVILFMGMRLSPRYHDQLFALGDLGRLLSTHICVVGALSEQDSLYEIAQRTSIAGVQPTKEEIEQFLLLSGGYPTLLKAVIRWWLTQSPVPPFDAWHDALLQEPSIQFRLREIVAGLSSQEQAALHALRSAADAPVPPALRQRLTQLGLCCQ